MKSWFFLSVLIGGGLAIIGFFVVKVAMAVAQYWNDFRTARATRRAAETLASQREANEAARLDNGCDHRFGATLGGFPPFACRRCGLERERPAGPCDHLWRLDPENAPGARCAKCGKTYKPQPPAGPF